MSYNSKYTGAQVEELLDQVASGNVGGGGGITSETDPIFSESPAAGITDKDISSWNNKVDKVDGKQLSTEDFTTLLKQKLDGLSNYDDSAIQESVSKLRTDLDTLVSGDTTTAIKTFNEVIAFLNGIEDSENLDSIIASIEQQIADKQDSITDLETIRSGAALGATALQIYTETDPVFKASAAAGITSANITNWNGKQDASIKFTDKVASTWTSDSTYADFPYRCDITCSGVTADMYAEVVFDLSQATSGNYAPVCETKSNVVSIWSKTNASITVPTILITK